MKLFVESTQYLNYKSALILKSFCAVFFTHKQSKYMLTFIYFKLPLNCTYRIDRMAAKYLLCSSTHKNV